jgi:thiol-disulfide isomerase/thioredoxin
VLFGLVLREALEDVGEATLPSPRVGGVVCWVVGVGCLVQVHQGWSHAATDRVIDARAGAIAPKVELPLLDGEKLDTGALHGRTVVLSFWATWCGPCLDELPVLQKIYRDRDPAAPLFYAINVDEAGPDRERAVKGVVRRLGLTFPVALDDGHATADYSVSTIPSLAKIDAEGNLKVMLDRPADEEELRDLLK